MKLTFFDTPAALRAWLRKHQREARELWVGFYKRSSGKPSITWPESVDQALCFGWIDGVRKSIDGLSYMIRFTPRKPRSIWSAVNTKRVAGLTRLGLMQSSGVKAFRERQPARSGIYSYEQRKDARFDQAQKRRFRADKTAWGYFQAQPPWYRTTATYWVMSARQEDTRVRRLATLIEYSRKGQPIPLLDRRPSR